MKVFMADSKSNLCIDYINFAFARNTECQE